MATVQPIGNPVVNPKSAERHRLPTSVRRHSLVFACVAQPSAVEFILHKARNAALVMLSAEWSSRMLVFSGGGIAQGRSLDLAHGMAGTAHNPTPVCRSSWLS